MASIVLKALNFAFSFASLWTNATIITSQHTTQTEDGQPVPKGAE